MNFNNLLRKVLLTGLVVVVPLSASDEIGFAGLAGAAASPSVEKFSALKGISIGVDSAQKEISADYLIAKLKRLNKEQKKFFIKYESGALNSTKDIAGFKIDLALLEYKTNSILTEVDTYLRSKNYGYKDSLELSKFDKALENEEKMRIKIEALISEMKFKQDRKYYKHRLLYHIKLGK